MMAKGKRDIGDPLDEVARTGKIGGRTSKSPDIQTSESSNLQSAETLNTQSVESPNLQQSNTPDIQSAETLTVQPSEKLNLQTSEMLNTQTFEMVKGQNMNSLAIREDKGTHKGRTQKTIYLPPSLAKQLKFASVEEEREISEIVTDALEAYFKNKAEEENNE
jgi:hypothetical protein